VLAALDRLHRHIDNEEHGLFPAAVIALPIDAWDRVTPEHGHDHDHSPREKMPAQVASARISYQRGSQGRLPVLQGQSPRD
jgi:hemerythrin-like domain-containing protein